VADYVRLCGSGRYAPGQSEDHAIADMRRELDGLEARFPGLVATLTPERTLGRATMPPFEIARDSRIVRVLNDAYRAVRGTAQPTGAVLPPGYYGTDAGHLQASGGMEGVVCGPGGRYNTMPDERVDIVDFLDMIRVYIRVILEICEVA
jgi:acetylornithine deacetylase